MMIRVMVSPAVIKLIFLRFIYAKEAHIDYTKQQYDNSHLLPLDVLTLHHRSGCDPLHQFDVEGHAGVGQQAHRAPGSHQRSH